MFRQGVLFVLFLQSVLGSPVENEPRDDQVLIEWVPPRYIRDLEFWDTDHWYKWWYGSKRKTLTTHERIQILETRQKALFDLVLCESHSRLRTFTEDECQLFRNKVEADFGIPSKGPAEKPVNIKPAEDDGSATIISSTATVTPNSVNTLRTSTPTTNNIAPNATPNVAPSNAPNIISNMAPNSASNVAPNPAPNVTQNPAPNMTPNPGLNMAPNSALNVAPNPTPNIAPSVSSNPAFNTAPNFVPT